MNVKEVSHVLGTVFDSRFRSEKAKVSKAEIRLEGLESRLESRLDPGPGIQAGIQTGSRPWILQAAVQFARGNRVPNMK